MSYTSRYLVSNKINLVVNENASITEYRPVYQRNINVYKGIDNTLDFRLLNADQKPIDLAAYSDIIFTLFDEEQKEVTRQSCTITDATKGKFNTVLYENTLLNYDQQYMNYNIYLVSTSGKQLTYSDEHFGNNGTIFLDAGSMPSAGITYTIDTFVASDTDFGVFYSEPVSGEPNINGNSALHTAVFFFNEFYGSIEIQATLETDLQSPDLMNWGTVATIDVTGSVDPVPVNFNGVYNYIRFAVNGDISTLSHIELRN